MNRHKYPIQWLQQKADEHTAYIAELRRIVGELKQEIDRLEETKANRTGRKKATIGESMGQIQ